MTTFDDREKAAERKYVQGEELAFKVTARRNKLLGLWAAEKLGKAGDEAEAYAQEVVESDFHEAGDDDVIGKVLADFYDAGIAFNAVGIKAEIERLTPIARQQVAGKDD